MLYLLLVVSIFSFELFKSSFPDEYEIMINRVVIQYNKLTLALEQKLLDQDIQKQLTNVSYNCIYFYSLCELQYNKCLSPYVNNLCVGVLTILKTCKIIKSIKTNVLFIKDGLVIKSIEYDIDYDKLTTQYFNVELNYDLIIILDYRQINKIVPVNHICLINAPENFSYEKPGVYFVSIQLEYEKKQYQICLKKDNYDFYITNNVINSSFFTYYLSTYLNVTMPPNACYKVELMDNNINFYTLNETDTLTIKNYRFEINAKETETLKPETLETETLKPETLKPETLKPETLKPETKDENIFVDELLYDFVNLDTDNLLYA